MRAILLVDHGSTRAEANAMLACMANLVQHLVGPQVIVRYAHMELAEPSIARGFTDCVEAGADEVIAFPYMLSPGKHSTRDIPRLVNEAAAPHQGVQFRVTPAFGVHEKLAELILTRAGVPIRNPLAGADAACCWDSARSASACGDACRLKGAEAAVIS
jgi:sirohydrochlorin ferrochelatase